MVTGIPTLAKFIEIPPPIVPAPITPTEEISFKGVSFSISGIFVTCLSAKKIYLCAADCEPVMSFINKSCSTFKPSSKGRLTAASTH